MGPKTPMNETVSGGRCGASQAARASFPVIPVVLVLGALALGVGFWVRHSATSATPPLPPDTAQTAPDVALPADDSLPVEVTGEVAPAAPSGKSAVAIKRTSPAVTTA